MRDILKEEEFERVRSSEVEGKLNDKYQFIFNDREELVQIISELKDVLRNTDLLGISAPEIGYKKRIFCMKFKDSLVTFINPSLTKELTPVLDRETLSSDKEHEYLIFRGNDIGLDYTTALGELKSISLLGKSAFVFQQLLDALEGLLVCDYGLPIDKDFDNLTEEEKDAVVTNYIKVLKEAEEASKKYIEEDEELFKMKKAVDFVTGVRKGEVHLVQQSGTEEKVEEKPTKKRGRPKKVTTIKEEI